MMDPIEAYRKAQQTRESLQNEAVAIGISEEYISILVDTFYTKVQAHPELGPMFNDHIQDRWPQHLAKMKQFWSSIALRTGKYEGQPVKAHRAIQNAEPGYFDIWLKLFRETLEETAPSNEVIDHFMESAERMAPRLMRAMFATPQ